MPRGIYTRTRKHREQSITNLGEGMLGKSHSDETIQKMKASNNSGWKGKRQCY